MILIIDGGVIWLNRLSSWVDGLNTLNLPKHNSSTGSSL